MNKLINVSGQWQFLDASGNVKMSFNLLGSKLGQSSDPNSVVISEGDNKLTLSLQTLRNLGFNNKAELVTQYNVDRVSVFSKSGDNGVTTGVSFNPKTNELKITGTDPAYTGNVPIVFNFSLLSLEQVKDLMTVLDFSQLTGEQTAGLVHAINFTQLNEYQIVDFCKVVNSN